MPSPVRDGAVASPPAPRPGQVAFVRQRRYLVEDVAAPAAADDATLVHLSCLDDDAQGQPLAVLWEHELDARVLEDAGWHAIARRGFDEPALFAAYLRTLAWNAVTATDPGLFQAPFRAGIRIEPYQLEPLSKALRLPRVNLFIADDVGLGKTIEAGLIMRELLLRRRVQRIVVSAPPSMLEQWRDELESRFGLVFPILDRTYVTRVRRERGFAVNPWTTHTRFLVSHRLLIDETYAAGLRDWLGDSAPQSLLVLDEAHHAAPAQGARYAIDSQTTRAVRDLAPRFEHRLFLSATPHNGHSNSFSALLEILDPQRFCRGVKVLKGQLDDVMVRRLKSDIREIAGGFPRRTVEQIDIDGLPPDAPELVLAEKLNAYREVRERRLAGASPAQRAAAALVLGGLQKRLLSSIEAFAKTLAVHRKRVAEALKKARRAEELPAAALADLTALTIGVDRDDAGTEGVDRADADEVDGRDGGNERSCSDAADEPTLLERMARATAASSGADGIAERTALERELALVDEMMTIAEASRYHPDARIEQLVAWIGRRMCPRLESRTGPPPPWTSARVIVFTEYEDTRRYVERCLREAIAHTERAADRIAVFAGLTPPAAREEIKHAFNTQPIDHPLRILIATDAAREGLNLQRHCADLFHFDLPWNPGRLDQRNGRIDRKLQPADEVFCRYFRYVQRPEDRVLRVLVRKAERIREELGSVARVVEDQVTDHLAPEGIRRTRIGELADRIGRAQADHRQQTAEEELEEETRARTKRVLQDVGRMNRRLEQSRRRVGVTAAQFRRTLSMSLRLAGVPGGIQARVEALDGGSSTVHERAEGDTAWPAAARSRGAPPMLSDSRPAEWGEVPASPGPRGDEAQPGIRGPAPPPGTPAPPLFDFPPHPTLHRDPAWTAALDTLRERRRRGERPDEWRRRAAVRPIAFEDTGPLGAQAVHLHLEHRLARRLLSRFTAQGLVHHDLSKACLVAAPGRDTRVMLLGRLVVYGERAARLHEGLVPVTARWTAAARRPRPLDPYGRAGEQTTLTTLQEALDAAGAASVPAAVQARLAASAEQDIRDLLPHLERRATEARARAQALLERRAEAESLSLRSLLERQRERIEAARTDTQRTFDFDAEERRQHEADRRAWDRRLRQIEDELEREPRRIAATYAVRVVRVDPVGIVYLWPQEGR